MARTISTLIRSDYKEAEVLYPANSSNESVKKMMHILPMNKYIKTKFIPCLAYGKNAGETRNNGNAFYQWMFTNSAEEFDVVIVEADRLALMLAGNNPFNNQIIYWVGYWNVDGTMWNEIGHEKINKFIATKLDTACSLPDQVDFFGGKCFFDECGYDPSLFDKKIIYFPFRLSDKSYKVDQVKEVMYKLRTNFRNFSFLYTDVNNSDVLAAEDKNIFVQVPTQKELYYAILKGRPIVPYLDNPDVNFHVNLLEMLYNKCDIIMKKNKRITKDKFPFVTFIEDDAELYDIIASKLKGENKNE